MNIAHIYMVKYKQSKFIEDGTRSKTQNVENSVVASSLRSSIFISVKYDNLVENNDYLISETFGRVNKGLLFKKKIIMQCSNLSSKKGSKFII